MSHLRNKKLKKIMLAAVAGMVFNFNGNLTVHAEEVDVSNNIVEITDNYQTVKKENSSEETVTVAEEFIYGGGNELNTFKTSKNYVTVNNGNFYGIFGGMSSSGEVMNNTVTFKNGEAIGIIGGVTFSTSNSEIIPGNVHENTVNIFGGNIGSVSGGEIAYFSNSSSISSYAIGGDVYKNIVNIDGGNIKYVVGGSALAGSSYGNEINIISGTINNEVIGGEVRYPSENSQVRDNIINIGEWGKTTAENLNLSDATFIGGISGSSYVSDGNLLNIKISGINIKNINFDSFEKINFWIPSDIQSGGEIVKISSGYENMMINKIGFAIDGGSNLDTGDTINLIINGNSSSFSADTVGNSTTVSMSKGATLIYDADLTYSADGVIATIGDINRDLTEQKGNPVSSTHKEEFPFLHNEIPDPFTGMMVDGMFDNNAGEDSGETHSDEAEAIVNPTMISGFNIFLNTGGGHIKTKTGGGTYIKTNSGNFDLGFARSLETQRGDVFIAPVIEYVHGSYESLLPNGIHGSGSTKYTAGGFIARNVNKHGIYYEGSLRGGRAKNEFASNDFVINDVPTRVTYDMSAPVFTGHLRFGDAKRLNRNNILDVYGVYSYARQNGMNTTLSSGDRVNFSSVDSHSFRLGYRLTTRTSRISRIYMGMAYQYDTSSDSTATALKYTKTAEGASGSSGNIELGWQIKPMKDNPWLLDLNAIGWIGHHQGFSATAKMQKSF